MTNNDSQSPFGDVMDDDSSMSMLVNSSSRQVVYSYTTKDATEDGMLVDLSSIGKIPVYAPIFRGIRYATSNLLSKGYIEGNTFNRCNLADLLVQVSKGIMKGLAKGEDRLFETRVEFPDGHREKVWAVLNEEGSLTLMLPEDY